MSTTDEAQAIDEMLDLPPAHRAVAQHYGRGMYALVLNCGLAGVATSVLARVIEHHRSAHGAKAVRVLASAFNQISQELARTAGWTDEMLQSCERDLQAASASAVVVPEEGRIVLPH